MIYEGYHVAHLPEHTARREVWRAIVQFLRPYFPPNAHVLELGAGYCDWINQVQAARKVAVDQWEQVSRYAGADVEGVCHDLLLGLDFLGESRFHVVLASNLLEHLVIEDASHLIVQVYERLHDGGRFILIQPNYRFAFRSYFDDYTHRTVFTDVSLPNLLRAKGFKIERVMPRFTPYSMRGTRLYPFLRWMVMLYLHSPVKPFAGQMLVIARR